MDDTTLSSRELEVLQGSLQAQRAHVLAAVDGLDEAAMRRAVLPSGWSPAGLVQHLALDVEMFWFRAVMAGEPAAIAALDQPPDNAWQVAAHVTAEQVLERYRRECVLADTVIAATPLDAPPAWWPRDRFGDWGLDDLRETVQHVIVETACHAGHLDAVRELLDGRQFLVLDG